MRLLLFLGLRLLGLRSFAAETDARNFHARQLPPMADGAMITFSAAILERDDFLVLALLEHFARHGRTFDERRAVSMGVAVAVKKDIGEDAFLARFLIEEIDIDDVSFGDAVLSAASLDNCVSHAKKPGEKPRKVPQVRRFDKGESGCGMRDSPLSRIPHHASRIPPITSVISPFAGCAS